jgi:SAM-dependent methyltransferase
VSDGDDLGHDLRGGAQHYRAFIGNSRVYDVLAAMQFNVLTLAGLREGHTLLDIGCGSLRAGRLFIPYLLPGNYYGVEPEEWLVQEGIDREVGADLVALKSPHFLHDNDFTLTRFERTFDYLLAQSVFSHATRAQITRCFSEAAQVMTPQSRFYATFFLGDHDYEGDEWVYPDLVPYTRKGMAAMATAQGLRCQLLDWPHPRKQTWMLLTPASAPSPPADADPATAVTRGATRAKLRRNPLGRLAGAAVRRLRGPK